MSALPPIATAIATCPAVAKWQEPASHVSTRPGHSGSLSHTAGALMPSAGRANRNPDRTSVSGLLHFTRRLAQEFRMVQVIVYVVSGTAAASALTPVDTATNIAGLPIVIGGGAQSIAVTPNGKTVYVPNGVHNSVTPVHTSTNTAL